MTVIAQKVKNENTFGRVLGENNDLAVLKKLIEIVKVGTVIHFTEYSKEITAMAFTLLRAYLSFTIKLKPLLCEKDRDAHRSCGEKRMLKKMLWYIRPDNLDIINSDIENTILSILT